MAAKKFAISVDEDVMNQVDQAAAQQGVSRSYFIVQVLRQVARARKDAEISRRIDAFFADTNVADEQLETARAFRRRAPSKGTQW